MRWKSMFVVIVLNIFLMLFATLLFEYLDLAERFASIEDSVQEALDLSVDISVKSEEFFTASYQAAFTSFAASDAVGNNGAGTASASVLLWSDQDKKFYQVNAYLLAHYYDENGHLPRNSGEISQANNWGSGGLGQTVSIFEWLYGQAATDYNDTALTSWANRNSSRKKEYRTSGITAGRDTNYSSSNFNSNFVSYYLNVGQYQKTAGYLKSHTLGTSSFTLDIVNYPTLANMGFAWMTEYNRTSSTKTADNLVSSIHIGKSRLGNKKTYYFLTPSSLGVTYIPTEVLKPVFLTSLDTIVRLNLLGSSDATWNSSGSVDDDDAQGILSQASECVSTNVYVNGTAHAEHTASNTSEDIVTDGLVEFDLSSAKVKVEYFYINLGDTSLRTTAEKVISKVNGAVQTYDFQYDEDESRSQTLDSFLTQDTTQYVNSSSLVNSFNNVKNGRIVAKVSVKIKVHVPYQSSLLQWMCQKFRGTTNHHYDIKLFDSDTRTAEYTSDGIWYQYSTWYCTSRS